MKSKLIALSHGYYFWGTSIYVGLLWSLHFVFYPSWTSINTESVEAHFLVPVNAATDFFTIVVPGMLLTGLIMVYTEWKTKQRWTALLAYGCLLVMMLVGYFLIRPVNESIAESIAAGTLQTDSLSNQLSDWMCYNDLRGVIMTTMWLIILFYYTSKAGLLCKKSDS